MKLVECPRDAMQGLSHFVPTDLKVRYLNALLRVGFDTLDFGSFVSPKTIPQLRDTAQVLAELDLSPAGPNGFRTKLLAIVANRRGGEEAAAQPAIQYIGFPLSVSETFQQRNTNRSIVQAMDELGIMQELCIRTGKILVVYLSMGFGNPYGDPYSPDLVGHFTDRLVQLGIGVIVPSDTIGSSTPDTIEQLFPPLITAFPTVEFGAHLHARPGTAAAKVRACVRAGVGRIDGALRGFGGCPMAGDDLVGNLPTEEIIQTLADEGLPVTLNWQAWQEAMTLSAGVF